MAMLNNQRVYPVYDRFKRNYDDTPMSLKLEPSSSEINAVHDSKNIAWLAGKKTENDAQMFFLRVQNLRHKIVYIPTDPAFKQPEFICHLEGMIMDYPIQTFIYIGQIAITTGCFFFQGAQPVMFLGLLISLIMNISISTIKPTDIGTNCGSQVLSVCKPL